MEKKNHFGKFSFRKSPNSQLVSLITLSNMFLKTTNNNEIKKPYVIFKKRKYSQHSCYHLYKIFTSQVVKIMKHCGT